MSLVVPKDKLDYQAIQAYQKTVVEGKTIARTAQEMKMSTDTVERRLAHGRRAGIFIQFEQKIYDELLPLAHEALKMALEDGDAQVALAIYKGKNLLNDNKPRTHSSKQEDEDFYGAIAELRQGTVIDVTPAGGFAGSMGSFIEATAEEHVVSSVEQASGVDGHQETATNEGEIGGEDSPQTTEQQLELF
jgi:hypothetical protein